MIHQYDRQHGFRNRYRAVAFIIACLYLTLQHFAIDENITIITSLVVGYLVRMASVRFKWRLPIFELKAEGSVH
ncbi:MAG: hypothetical protein ACTH6Y_06730 [Vibrio hibernica]